MGRRSRARERAARPAPPGRGQAAGQDQAAGQAEGAGRPRRGRWAAALNPFSFQPPTRSRVGYAAIAFGLLAVVSAALAWLTDTAAWFNSAVLLAILAVAWGARAALMGGDARER
jgi:hypothetical protein